MYVKYSDQETPKTIQHNTMQLTQDSHFSKKKRSASGGTRTRDILRSRHMLYQAGLNHTYKATQLKAKRLNLTIR